MNPFWEKHQRLLAFKRLSETAVKTLREASSTNSEEFSDLSRGGRLVLGRSSNKPIACCLFATSARYSQKQERMSEKVVRENTDTLLLHLEATAGRDVLLPRKVVQNGAALGANVRLHCLFPWAMFAEVLFRALNRFS